MYINTMLKNNLLETNQVIKSPQKRKLLENLEEVLKDIENGKSYRYIAERYGVHVEVVWWLVNQSEHSARAKTAQIISSYNLIDDAEQEIEKIQADDTAATVRKQVEKMNILLFKAKVKNRKDLDFSYKDTASPEIALIVPQLTIKRAEPIKTVKTVKKATKNAN